MKQRYQKLCSATLNIICSSKLTVFLELRSRKTVRFSKPITSTDKYPSIFSRQMKAFVYLFCRNSNNGITFTKTKARSWSPVDF